MECPARVVSQNDDAVCLLLCPTVHEVREIDQETAFLGISVAKHPVVYKTPPKRIRDEDDDALGSDALGRLSNVRGEAMDGCLQARRGFNRDTATKAIWTGHDGDSEGEWTFNFFTRKRLPVQGDLYTN